MFRSSAALSSSKHKEENENTAGSLEKSILRIKNDVS